MKLNLRKLVLIIFLVFSSQISFSQGKIFDTEFSSLTRWDSASSISVDPKTNPGEIILKTGEHENLALRKSAYIVYAGVPPVDTALSNPQKILDGNPMTCISFPNNSRNEGSGIRLDLQATRMVNRISMSTLGENPSLRVRAYTVYVSKDSIGWDKVYQELNNLVSPSACVFEPVECRYIIITIDVIDRGISTVISELEVYGVGYLSTGAWYSTIRDIGKSVNWGTFSYNASVPEGTKLSFQFRSGSASVIDDSWCDWSDPVIKDNTLFKVDEPRRYFQYKVNLVTNSLETPRLKDITINYDSLLVVKKTSVTLIPNETPILRPADISYVVTTTVNDSSLGIDTMVIETPSPAYLQSVTVDNNPVTYHYTPEQKKIQIAFLNTVKSSSNITAKFRITPYLDRTDFVSSIISKQTPGNPQVVEATRNGKNFSWTLFATETPPRLLVEAKVEPNPFSPNGDGINDKTEISFYLSNLNIARPLIIKIHDISGKVIRDLINENTTANAFIEKNAFSWDGKNNNGKIVPPGVYILQVNIGSDTGGETITKTITVVY